jgi:hypothetical protein
VDFHNIPSNNGTLLPEFAIVMARLKSKVFPSRLKNNQHQTLPVFWVRQQFYTGGFTRILKILLEQIYRFDDIRFILQII